MLENMLLFKEFLFANFLPTEYNMIILFYLFISYILKL